MKDEVKTKLAAVQPSTGGTPATTKGGPAPCRLTKENETESR